MHQKHIKLFPVLRNVVIRMNGDSSLTATSLGHAPLTHPERGGIAIRGRRHLAWWYRTVRWQTLTHDTAHTETTTILKFNLHSTNLSSATFLLFKVFYFSSMFWLHAVWCCLLMSDTCPARLQCFPYCVAEFACLTPCLLSENVVCATPPANALASAWHHFGTNSTQ